MNLLLYIFVLACGVVGSAIATHVWMHRLVVMPLQRDRDAYLKIAREAQTDVRLVKALRAGELDLDTLMEVGVLDEADGPADDLALPALEPGTYPALGPGPRFIPNFYKRAPKVADLAPGDEAWVHLHYVDADRRGNPVVYAKGETETYESKGSDPFGRLRVYEDGSLELASYPDDLAGADLVDAGDSRYRPVARVVNLDTEETRELAEVTLCTQLDT